MKEHQALQERYADLLHTERDPQFLQVVQDLDSICHTPQAPARLTWAEVRVMHNQQTVEKRANILPFRARARHQHPLLRKAVLMPVLIGLVLVTAAFTITISPLLREALGFVPSGKSLLQNNLFVGIHQSQTIDGETLTLEGGYADANQVILGYTISPFHFGLGLGGSLSTKGGVDLLAIVGGSTTDLHTADATVLAFQTGNITGNPQTLDLQLKLHARYSTDTSKSAKLRDLGTFTFNFTLPFHPGRVVTPEQRATSHGKTATLQRVVVTRSATNVIVQGLPFLKINRYVAQDMPHITIQAPGENDTCNTGSSPFCNLVLPPEGDGTWSFIDPHDFSQAQGTWTLTVQEGIDTWVFHFVVPA